MAFSHLYVVSVLTNLTDISTFWEYIFFIAKKGLFVEKIYFLVNESSHI